MYTNNLEIIVYAPIKKVWKALTDGEKIKVWMKNVKVETDWKEGSPILFTVYDNFGNIMTWEGKQMIWDGIIEKFVPGRELVVIYPSKATGLEKEVFHLVEVFPEVTKIHFEQECIGKYFAENYKEDTYHTLEKLRQYVENH